MVQGSGFGVWVLGFRFWVSGSRFPVSGFGYLVSGTGTWRSIPVYFCKTDGETMLISTPKSPDSYYTSSMSI